MNVSNPITMLRWILDDEDEILIMDLMLYLYAQHNGYFEITYPQIIDEADLDCGLTTVKRRLDSLIEKGLLHRTERTGHRGKHFSYIPDFTTMSIMYGSYEIVRVLAQMY